MTTDLDIYRTANVLIREHGEDAAIEAAMQADAVLDKGRTGAYLVWKRTVRAVNEIQRQESREWHQSCDQRDCCYISLTHFPWTGRYVCSDLVSMMMQSFRTPADSVVVCTS